MKLKLSQRHCSVNGCNKSIRTKGFCGMHYARNKRNGSPLIKTLSLPLLRYCSMINCGRKYFAKDFCSLHYQRFKSHGSPFIKLIESHGKKNSRIYNIWQGMKARCQKKYSISYKYYGRKGIKICEEWIKFSNFYRDMGECPEGKSLDRIDNNGDYCKQNCRWASRKEQQRNRSSNCIYAYDGRTKCIAEWAEEYGFRYDLLRQRIRENNWSMEDALSIPKGGRRPKPLQ